MVKIFVSHTSQDSALALRLTNDLRNAGHDAKVDLNELKLGDNVISFINNAIANSDFVILLRSVHSDSAIWQNLEADAAIWNEKGQNGAKTIVIRIDNVQVPPILGPKVFGNISLSDPSTYDLLFTRLCQDVLPRDTASSNVAQAFRNEGHNPFRRVRAEYFEDNPDLLVKTFAPPEPLKLSSLHELRPCFLEGSRGTGKSMLLLSMRARNYRLKRIPGSPDLFGVYLKLTGGAGCNPGIASGRNTDEIDEGDLAVLTDISNQEFIVYVIESLLSEVQFCLQHNVLICEEAHKKYICNEISKVVFGTRQSPSDSIESLLESLAEAHLAIAEYIRRRFIYSEAPSVPIASLDLQALKRVIKIIRQHMHVLKETLFILLLDEYENLPPYYQRVVNTIVKFAAPDLSVKVAKKLGTNDISGTTVGQELQETHDYARLSLVYDVGDSSQLSDYRALLDKMVRNVMESEGYTQRAASEVLPSYDISEIDEDSIQAELLTLAKGDSQDQRSYYLEAAIRRVLIARGEKKRYAGFDDLSFLSSGVIRYFQEIVGVAFFLETSKSSVSKEKLSLSPETQSQAAYIVSEHNLTALSRNIERVGERLKYFVLDLGDLIKRKLTHHASEPESGRITIEDPEKLTETADVAELLRIGVKEGALQTKGGRPAFRARHQSDPQPAEFNLCRIFAPVLEISPRYRWRYSIRAVDLQSLANSATRMEALRKLMRKIPGEIVDVNQLPLGIHNEA